jgi:predicted nucleic acid-binding protein
MPRSWAYFDTSVLVKRYVREVASSRVRALLRGYRFLSSAVAPVEATSALRRRRDAGELAERDFVAALARLHQDRAHWELVEVSPLVLGRAEELVRETSLATLDAIHVASAILFQSTRGIRVPFVAADVHQREAAERLALALVWVE